MFTNNYSLGLFLTHSPLSSLEIVPAVQSCQFCLLALRFNGYLRLGPQFLQKTPWNLVFLADKPLELVFGLDYAF